MGCDRKLRRTGIIVVYTAETRRDRPVVFIRRGLRLKFYLTRSLLVASCFGLGTSRDEAGGGVSPVRLWILTKE